MRKLFGTDGIRGVAFKEPITEETAEKLGSAVIHFCTNHGMNSEVVIGRDTRESGQTLEAAVTRGVISVGGRVLMAGELSTPAVAFLAREKGAGAGLVISASHNPHEYNGFKIFTGRGYKLSEKEEEEIEEIMAGLPATGRHNKKGSCEILENPSFLYESFIRKTVETNFSLRGTKIVLDCANGATWQSAPRIIKNLGAKVEALAISPNGRNINQACGSEHTETLKHRVIETSADVGLAFDGDGDRLVAIDEKGNKVTGDQIIAICARMLISKGKLKNKLVVSTVMSNMGLGIALKKLGASLITTKVGDRHVMEEMRSRNACLGGEDSGHIIFSDHHTTGDGLISAFNLLTAVKDSRKKLSELSVFMKVFPQTLVNVPVACKPDIRSVMGISHVLKDVEERLGERGRVLVRYSGTEPLCRVMVEGETEEEVSLFASEIALAIKKEIGGE